jgi:hypothetical protein
VLAGGVLIEIVPMILSHSTPEITRRVYAHPMCGHGTGPVGATCEQS